MPLTCWAWFVTSVLILLAFSILLVALTMLMLDRHAGTSFFVPSGPLVSGKPVDHSGGSPLLWQHLFWFFGHPEVYIAILPAMGVTSHLLSVFARKPVFGYKAMVGAILAIGGLGFMVWGHHMFVSGMNPHAGFAFSTLTTAIAVPSAIKTFNWVATLYGGRIRYTTPLLFSVGFVSLFITGGLTGPFLAQPTLDVYLHDTYFVIAHFHLIMAMAGVFAIFSATYFWFPKMFGRMMNERLGECTSGSRYLVLMHIHAHASPGNCRPSTALFRSKRRTIRGSDGAIAEIHYSGGHCYHFGADHLFSEPVLEHAKRAGGRSQSLGVHDAGVDGAISATVR